MKVFIVGDLTSDNGPANVNKIIKKYSKADTMFSEERNKIKRIKELVVKIKKSEVVIFSGLSNINVIGLMICRLLKKKCAYLMHGCVEYECSLNKNSDRKEIIKEKLTLFLAPKIICVSRIFKEWFVSKYNKYKYKTNYVMNCVEVHDNQESILKEKNYVMSIGGGVPSKNIKYICKAIQKINEEDNMNLKLIVIGRDGKDTEEIKKYSFVEYKGVLTKEEVEKCYRSSLLYIQNSTFETFGLSVLECLHYGCSLLISKNIGAVDVFENLQESDLIDNTYDVNEIAIKIKEIIKFSNNSRVLHSIDTEKIDLKKYYTRLVEATALK